MATVPPAQTAHLLEFIDLVKQAVGNNCPGITSRGDSARNTALALLMDMANSGIGLTFPDPLPTRPEEEPPF